MDLSQNNVCLKCNEGGDLLTCSGCPLVIHEGCMTCSAKFDETGNFYCPHCSLKRTLAELSQARKNVKLTRKALSIFMGEHNNEAETGKVEGEKIQEDESETSSASTDQTMKENSETCEESTDKSGEETGNVEGVNIQEEKSETSSASTDQTWKENSETYEESTDKSGEREISSKVKDLTGEEDCENSSDSIGGHRSTGHVRANRRMSDSSCEDTPARKKHVKRSRTHSAQVTNKSSDEEFDDSCSESSKWTHPKRPSVKLDNNIGNMQRRRVMWTEEEVEMLKLGVKTCSSPTKKIIPWKKILRFGRRVFNKTRAPMDLKEKWKKIAQKT